MAGHLNRLAAVEGSYRERAILIALADGRRPVGGAEAGPGAGLEG
jgi:hypothetical protein